MIQLGLFSDPEASKEILIDLIPTTAPEKSKSKISGNLSWSSPNSDLEILWFRLANFYFPERPDLGQYSIQWSERSQKRVLGSCNLTKKRIIIARALDRPELRWVLEPLVYHEMCHAVVGVRLSQNGRRKSYHGPEFYDLERLHPGTELLDSWIKSGGWQSAVRSFASHRGFKKRVKS